MIFIYKNQPLFVKNNIRLTLENAGIKKAGIAPAS
jgi:hypothetical protein